MGERKVLRVVALALLASGSAAAARSPADGTWLRGGSPRTLTRAFGTSARVALRVCVNKVPAPYEVTVTHSDRSNLFVLGQGCSNAIVALADNDFVRAHLVNERDGHYGEAPTRYAARIRFTATPLRSRPLWERVRDGISVMVMQFPDVPCATPPNESGSGGDQRPEGAAVGGAAYTVRFDPAKRTYLVRGPKKSPQGCVLDMGGPENNQQVLPSQHKISFWGRVFDFDEDGNLYDNNNDGNNPGKQDQPFGPNRIVGVIFVP